MKTQSCYFTNGRLLCRLFFISLSLALVMWSCNINPSLQEVSQPNVKALLPTAKALPTTYLLPSTVSLDKIDLFFDKGMSATGNLQVSISSSLSGAIVGSVVLSVSSLMFGRAWHTFTFPGPVTLNRGEKYHINVLRLGDQHAGSLDRISWLTSVNGVDSYPNGINNFPSGWILDYAFKTYTQGGVDQQQTSVGPNYGFVISDFNPTWQEFKADYPRVSLNSIALNLVIGSAATGTLTLEIRSADGITVLAQNTVTALSLGLETFKWSNFKISALLYRDQLYRIYVIRSDRHNSLTNNYIYWNTSSNGADVYPDGINDPYPSLTLDYAFRTYSAISGLDQYQNLSTYGFFTQNDFYRWQEFVPRHQ